MKGTTWPAYLMVAAIAAVIVWLLMKDGTTQSGVVTTQHDTVTRYVWHDPVYIDRAITRTSRIHDTVTRVDTVVRYMTPDSLFCAPAFTATLDTIVNKDTIGVSFNYPQATLSVMFRQSPDTVRTVTITNTKTERIERAWWIDALTHVGAATLGYAVGRSR